MTSKWSLFFMFSNQNSAGISTLSYACQTIRPSIFPELTTAVMFGEGYNFRKPNYEHGRRVERVEDFIDKIRSENKFKFSNIKLF